MISICITSYGGTTHLLETLARECNIYCLDVDQFVGVKLSIAFATLYVTQYLLSVVCTGNMFCKSVELLFELNNIGDLKKQENFGFFGQLRPVPVSCIYTYRGTSCTNQMSPWMFFRSRVILNGKGQRMEK